MQQHKHELTAYVDGAHCSASMPTNTGPALLHRICANAQDLTRNGGHCCTAAADAATAAETWPAATPARAGQKAPLPLLLVSLLRPSLTPPAPASLTGCL